MSKMKPYVLKMTEEQWSQLDSNRMSLVGSLYPQGITRADYIRNAFDAYNKYFEEKVSPAYRNQKNLQDPIGFYHDNGLDVVKW